MTRLLPLLAAGLLVACDAQQPPAPTTADAPRAANDGAALAADGDVVASYACEGGNTVALVRDGRVARLSLSDGRTIRLGEIAGSHPHTWADMGLRFIVEDDFVELSQSNGEYSLSCQEEQ